MMRRILVFVAVAGCLLIACTAKTPEQRYTAQMNRLTEKMQKLQEQIQEEQEKEMERRRNAQETPL